MATKKKTEEVESLKSKVESKLIISPRMTEKASMQSSSNAYTFVVAKNATKVNLMREVVKEYKVTPKKITILNTPPRNVFVRGRKGVQAGIKKAIIFLKKGDTITISQ